LYDVLVVGHWDIVAILGAAYEEVGLHCQSPDSELNRKWLDTEYVAQLRRRNDGVESRAFLRLGSGACPETPQSIECRGAPKRPTGFASLAISPTPRQPEPHALIKITVRAVKRVKLARVR
jgi:hypothetical protein